MDALEEFFPDLLVSQTFIRKKKKANEKNWRSD